MIALKKGAVYMEYIIITRKENKIIKIIPKISKLKRTKSLL